MPDFSLIVRDNEGAVQDAVRRGDNVQAFLLVHALVESLLREFLKVPEDEAKFHDVIGRYKAYLQECSPGVSTFVDELTQFNRRRNRIIHELWRKGYTFTNNHAKDAAIAAVLMYGLLIEFLQTFEQELADKGFEYGS